MIHIPHTEKAKPEPELEIDWLIDWLINNVTSFSVDLVILKKIALSN